MTIETRTTIQLSDLQAVEFECKYCHRVLSYPLAAMKMPPAGCDCPGAPQWMTIGDKTFCDLIHLVELMQRYGKSNGERFALRFVVNGLSEKGI